MTRRLSRRDFLKLAGMAGLGTALTPEDLFAQYRYLAPVSVANPLAAYPNRDWEQIYRNIFRTDKSFVFLCCPNDTHNCLLNAFVKNNVMVRIEPPTATARRPISMGTSPVIAGIRVAARRAWCCTVGCTATAASMGPTSGAGLRSGWIRGSRAIRRPEPRQGT